VSGDWGLPPNRPDVSVVRPFRSKSQLHLGVGGDPKGHTAPRSRQFRAAVFPRRSPFGAVLEGSQFERGRECWENLKRLCSFCASASLDDRVTRIVARFFVSANSVCTGAGVRTGLTAARQLRFFSVVDAAAYPARLPASPRVTRRSRRGKFRPMVAAIPQRGTTGLGSACADCERGEVAAGPAFGLCRRRRRCRRAKQAHTQGHHAHR
jgi:hypothetical protein